MDHTSSGAGSCELNKRDVTRTQTEKFAVAAYVLHIIGFLQFGGVFLDQNRRVLSLNQIAANSLGNGLVVRENHLVAVDSDSDTRLQSSIDLALTRSESTSVPAIWLELSRNERTPLLMRILRLEESIRSALNGASLLLVAFDLENCQAPPAGLLMRMFELTPAEAEVAIGIARGKRVAEIAADRGVKVDTVRTYLKIALGKTGTRGQAELAALLTRLAILTDCATEN
jgi:DNA-binding CsgD family transcriptional regulator